MEIVLLIMLWLTQIWAVRMVCKSMSKFPIAKDAFLPDLILWEFKK